MRAFRLALVAAGVAVLVIAALWAGARVGAVRRALGGGEATISHDIAVERLRAVAQLVTSETGVRDVVTYRRTWLGSTKQALVVVTGRVLAGINLEHGTEIAIDERTRHIAVRLPHARVLGVEVTALRTYDERSGLWNPFRPSDRDSIFDVARRQLEASAGEMGIVPHAEESARRVLEGLFRDDGYATTVTFVP